MMASPAARPPRCSSQLDLRVWLAQSGRAWQAWQGREEDMQAMAANICKIA